MFFQCKRRDEGYNGQRVYVYAHEDDRGTYFDIVSDLILENYFCEILYSADPFCMQEVIDKKINMIIILVTKSSLADNSAEMKEILFDARKHHIVVFPICDNRDILRQFNQDIGNRECFLIERNEQIQAAVKENLSIKLGRVLISNADMQAIREHFSMLLFLSYRKMDNCYVEQLMRLLHKEDWGRDIGIWYDGSLTPGEDFNEEIQNNLHLSKAMLLLVTPHLLEPNNYVMDQEYPEAMKSNIPVIPFQLTDTELDELEQYYPGIRDHINLDSEDAIMDALQYLRRLMPEDKQQLDNSPIQLFYMGLAYLLGIHVEKDSGRGGDLILQAAEEGFFDAMLRVGFMYLGGDGCPVDEELAYDWLGKAVRFVYDKLDMLDYDGFYEEYGMSRKNGQEVSDLFVSHNNKINRITDAIDCLMKLMQKYDRWEYAEMLSVICRKICSVRCGVRPLVSKYDKIVGYEITKDENGKRKVGKSIHKDIYKVTGEVRDDVYFFMKIILDKPVVISKEEYDKLKQAYEQS